MKEDSRRHFLAAGLGLPVAGMAAMTTSSPNLAEPATALQSGSGFSYRTLGKTGLKVTSVGFGCMITSDPSVIERAADIGITYFDSARGYQGGNNERMVGAALKNMGHKVASANGSPVGGFEGIMFTPDANAGAGCAPADAKCTAPISGIYRAGSNFREDGQAAGY